MPIASWRMRYSRQVITGAQSRGVKSAGRLADIGQDLAAMRKLAWREGWLPRDVDAMAAAADHLTVHGAAELRRLPLLGSQIRVAGYIG